MEIFLITLACLIAVAVSYARRAAHLSKMRERTAAAGKAESWVGEMLDTAGGQDRLDSIVVVNPSRKRAQIDHLVRGERVLVVVETKNWNGILSGGVDDEHWLLRRPTGEVARMRNPLSQAGRQARIVSGRVGEGVPVRSLVVMAGRTRPYEAEFPQGIVELRKLQEVLPLILAQGDGDVQAVSDAWTSLVDEAFSKDASRRSERYMQFLDSRFGLHPWHSWLVVALSLAAVAWTMALCLKALQMKAEGRMY
jgi:hypothetical protein